MKLGGNQGQGFWLPSHTDTAGHTKAFDYPVTQTRLHIPTFNQGIWLPSHTDTAGHTKAFDYPVTQTQLDIPRPLITQSWTCKADTNQQSVSPQSNTLTTVPPVPLYCYEPKNKVITTGDTPSSSPVNMHWPIVADPGPPLTFGRQNMEKKLPRKK